MTLDINPDWVTFNHSGHPDALRALRADGSKHYPHMNLPSDHYLGTARKSRDFNQVSLPWSP